ncbi:PRC-barrel domain-containing protein [Roseomonas xinghualingensis]|uniref:PRC-barrel domain-containing protein n=1 Tax=Roseomonas xinghualingensis TaxID=2986475 RepID=UPI0021F1F31C|nr:PRC-barrel domain-containing protein [Roseomonas sp. SXEYE001]MCV4206042.1 PRC-barrel domain-containing protein [Roseomonas sp. SXEYE001]
MRFMPIAVVLAGLATLSSPVLAQAPAASSSTPQAGATGVPPGHILAEELIDSDVYTADNVEIGEVEDLIIDPQGRVALVVIEVEKRLGLPQKHVGVPLNRLRMQPNGRANLDMPSSEVRSLPAANYNKR